MQLKKLICLIAYYSFAKFLPASTSSMTSGLEALGEEFAERSLILVGQN